MKISDNILDFIGNTPMIELRNVNPYPDVKIYAKLENLNPTGSIKDRVAKCLIEEAEEQGKLKKGMTIIEPTSGNTGIAFSMISKIKGYDFIAILPEFASKERVKIMEHYGAKIVITPSEKNMQGTLDKSIELAKEYDSFIPNQFENKCNVGAQILTGKEILKQIDEDIDFFIAGVGTGGTILGIGTALKDKNHKTKTVAIEPENSSILTNGKVGFHKIEGIGEGFIPKLVKDNVDLIDRVMMISDEDALNMSKELSQKEGLFVGISSGANVFGALKLAKEIKKGIIVTVLPDNADRYFSTDLFK